MKAVARFFPSFSLCYVAALVVLSVVYFLRYPIVFTDSDLWIHLSEGQYIAQRHALPTESYFSFLTPARPFVDFRWFFQLLLYGVYALGGYPGLIVLRACCYLASVLVVVRFLLKGQTDPAARRWLTLLGTFYVCLLPLRHLNLRPHSFDYVFIPLLLSILELAPRRAVWLPFVAILWCNLHGAVYPVLLLLLGAYGLEYIVNRFRGGAYSAQQARQFFLPAALSMAAIYLTPHGGRLLEVPFRDHRFLSLSIGEMIPVAPQQWLSFVVVNWLPTIPSLVNVFLVVVVVILASSIAKRSLRVSHLCLCAGGLFLFLRANRFIYEFILLSLPLLRAHPFHLRVPRFAGIPRWMVAVVAAVVLAIPFRLLHQTLVNREAYPFSIAGLPEGITTFLRKVHATGKVLNPPNTAGYWRWKTYPSCTILMDLDILFRDEDFYLAFQVFSDREVLRAIITRYDPSFISVPLASTGFKKLAEELPDYRLVFFDDAEALYVNRRHAPELVGRYELRAIDPFAFSIPDLETAVDAAEAARLEPMAHEAKRMLDVYPMGGSTNLLIGRMLTREGGYDRALPHADAIIRYFPYMPQGYWLKGDAYRGLGLPDLALAQYRQALIRATEVQRASITRTMAKLQFERGRYAEAYRAFARQLNMFNADVVPEDLYQFGFSALRVRRLEQAKALFTYLLEFRLPPNDTMLRHQVEDALGRMPVKP